MKTEDEVEASSSVASAATMDLWVPRTSSIEAIRFRTELNVSGRQDSTAAVLRGLDKLTPVEFELAFSATLDEAAA